LGAVSCTLTQPASRVKSVATRAECELPVHWSASPSFMGGSTAVNPGVRVPYKHTRAVELLSHRQHRPQPRPQ
jgi:hypothetical protein